MTAPPASSAVAKGDQILIVFSGAALKMVVTHVFQMDELMFDVVQEGGGGFTGRCRASEEGRRWLRGWDEETAAALQAAWALATDW